jgi:hypothetical protein
MPEDIDGIEEYKNASTGKGQNVPAPTEVFSISRTATFQRRASF